MRCRDIALTCEVGGDSIWTTVARPEVTTVPTTVPAHTTKRDHVREPVVRTGRKPSSLGRQPDSAIGDWTGRKPTSVARQHRSIDRTDVRGWW